MNLICLSLCNIRPNSMIRAILANFVFSLTTHILLRVTCLPQGHYDLYETGVTFMHLPYLDAGPLNPNAKWNAECFDGQALVGFRDNNNDFERLSTAKCRRAFPLKTSTFGHYPYYERCQLRNITHREEFLCFDPEKYPNSINTFITAIWDDDDAFLVWAFRRSKPFIGTAFKCCGTPPGYEIDYTACQLRRTHNDQWEYYDTQFFVMECPDTFVMTGIGVAPNPIDYDLHYDWIQCCPLVYQPAPVSHRFVGSLGLDAESFREFQKLSGHPFPANFSAIEAAVPASPPVTTTSTSNPSRVRNTAVVGAALAVQAENSAERASQDRGNRVGVPAQG